MSAMAPARPGLHPDRALPVEGAVRDVAREILSQTASLPILSMHGHVPVEILESNEAFADPASLLVTPDHYLVRMLVSQGVSQDALGIARRDRQAVEGDARAIWRTFASHWHLFRGTPTRFWLEHVLAEVFGIEPRLSPQNADQVFEHLSEQLARPEFRPLALMERLGIEVLATTDAADADLSSHQRLAGRGYADRIIPTLRPDAILRIDREGWRKDLVEFGRRAGLEIIGYRTFLAAIEMRRRAFIEAGGRATDHGPVNAETSPLDRADAERIVRRALRGEATAAEADAFSAHMLFEMARMSSEDGLVMQLHPGIVRDHDPRTQSQRGSDVGYDIPMQMEYTRSLRPMLSAFGHHPGFTLVLFTVDESTFSRELAPLAGVYPAVRLGAPWWFLDSPDGMRRFREAVTDTAGFYNTAGFVDDTRAFLSIPARHDLARRVDAGHLARLGAEHRLGLDEAIETAAALAYDIPKAVYPVIRRSGAAR